jgi:aspartyl protease family protein
MRGHLAVFLIILGVIALGALAVWILGEVTGIAAFDTRAPEMIFYISLLLLLMVGGLNAPRLGLRDTARNILIWAAVFVVLVIGYSYRDELEGVWKRVSGEVSPGTTDVQGRSLTVRAGAGGHFYLDVGLNGATTTMLIDTGATSTVISQATARRAGLDPGALSYTITLSTANGTVQAAPTRIARMTIGPLTFRDARVLVTGRKGDRTDVVGIETLRLFRSYQVTGNSFTLRW